MLCAAALIACNKEAAVEPSITVDLASIDVEAQNPEDVSVTLKSNVTWLLNTPSWVTASTTYGGGDAIITFSFATNYKDELTTVAGRSGEIKISGGGSITGKGVTVVIPVAQQGFTYVDPNPPIGNIPNVTEFVEFLKAAASGGSCKRWLNDANEVELVADIDLTGVEYDWDTHIFTGLGNGNNDTGAHAETSEVAPKAFKGVFNGGNHKITGFKPTVVLPTGGTFGLFPLLIEGTVKNVNLTGEMNVTATGTADAGMLVGTAINSTIQNVKINGKIVSAGTTASARFAVGSVVGYIFGNNDKYCVVDGAEVNVLAEIVGGSNTANGATGAMYGGVAGFATAPNVDAKQGVIIKNCVNNGDMNVTLGRCSGIVATANTGTTLENCVNNGDQVNKIANGRLGNIVCNLSHYCHVKNCVNNGDLDATASGYKGTAGGVFALAGAATITLEGLENYGTIKTLSTAGKYIGLLWANHNATIPTTNCVASGRIIVDGVEREINESNYMSNLGSIKDQSCIGTVTWVAPK